MCKKEGQFGVAINTPSRPSPLQGKAPFSVVLDFGVSAQPESFSFNANGWWNRIRLTQNSLLCKVSHRTIYQLRHTFACWNLTVHGNVAFIAKQMGDSDYTMLVKIYGRWMDAESKSENSKIWDALKVSGHVENAPREPQLLKRLK